MVATEDIREKVTDWFTSAGACFLLGAGCSKCVGKPLIQELTKQVLCKADEKLKEQFDNLKLPRNRSRTIEDLMNYLMRYREVLSSIKNVDDHSLKIEDINAWLDYVKDEIVAKVGDDWERSEVHEKFLRRLCATEPKQVRDIFCLNYDTILEASLDHIRQPYIDGFRGTVRGWFDAGVFDESEAKFKIFKLHGSVSWVYDDGCVRRRTGKDGSPVVVYPSGDKHIQTQYGVYELLMERFRKRLRVPAGNNRLIVLGYSFNDEHINKAISDAIKTHRNNLTVIAFVGRSENNPDGQEQNFRNLIDNSDDRFNVFLGSDSEKTGAYLGNIVERDMGDEICKREFWKFEKLVDYIT